MNINDMKLELIQKILSLKDEALLSEIYTKVKIILKDEYQINENYNSLNESNMAYTIKENDTIVGSTPDRKSITQADLIARTLQSEKEFQEGKYITLEDLEKESESW
jgi:hypothetical protein